MEEASPNFYTHENSLVMAMSEQSVQKFPVTQPITTNNSIEKQYRVLADPPTVGKNNNGTFDRKLGNKHDFIFTNTEGDNECQKNEGFNLFFQDTNLLNHEPLRETRIKNQRSSNLKAANIKQTTD